MLGGNFWFPRWIFFILVFWHSYMTYLNVFTWICLQTFFLPYVSFKPTVWYLNIKKNFRGGAFSPNFFLLFIWKSSNFGVFWSPKQLLRARAGHSGVTYIQLSRWGGQNIGGHGPPGPPLTTSLKMITTNHPNILSYQGLVYSLYAP